MFLFNKYKNHYIDIFLLIVSAFWVILAFVYPLHNDEALWFSRSGGVMVLLAVIIEYKSITTHNKYISTTIQAAIVTRLPLTIHKTKIQSYIDIIAHIYVILGTLIWAYGDLIKC